MRPREARRLARHNPSPAAMEAMHAARDAAAGTIANLALAAGAGLIGGNIHPEAPQVIYAVAATVTGLAVVRDHRTVGMMLVVGGSLVSGALIMRALVASAGGNKISDVPSDPAGIAQHVGHLVANNGHDPDVAPGEPSPVAGGYPTLNVAR